MLIPSAKHVRTKHHFVPIIVHMDISVIKNFYVLDLAMDNRKLSIYVDKRGLLRVMLAVH